MKNDFNECVDNISISSTDHAGEDFSINGYRISIVISQEEAVQIIAEYDPSIYSSPPAAESREIARVVLDALKVLVEG